MEGKMRTINFCPLCGGKMVLTARRDRSRPVCSRCGYVFYLNPVVAAGTLVDVEGRIALVRRGIQPGLGLWGLPAGYVEADETTEEAAVRETLEETGLLVGLDELLGVYSFGDVSEVRGVLTLYSAHYLSGELKAGDDASDVRFYSPEELPSHAELAFETHRRALDDWRRTRAVHVRPVRDADAEPLAKLRLRQAAEAEADNLLPSAGPITVLVAADGAQLAGYVAVGVGHRSDEANIAELFVLPAYRRWGIGTHLLTAAVDECRDRGMALLIAEASTSNPGVLVYLRAGFHIAGYLDRTPENGPSQLFLACSLR
jgi:ADP-ribose pyrophosphatase YjhB (NUDIX family)/N-acetylglutamate synthase-like GNAT family acetyltransferase